MIVISPKTNRIIWQYGHNGVPGRAAGYWTTPTASTWLRRLALDDARCYDGPPLTT